MKLIKIYSRHVKKNPNYFGGRSENVWTSWPTELCTKHWYCAMFSSERCLMFILTMFVPYTKLILDGILLGSVWKKRKERNLETYYKKYYKLTPIRERKNRMRIVGASSSRIFIAANQPLPNTCANNTGLDKTYSRRN